MSSPAIALEKLRFLLGQLKTPGCHPVAGSREFVTQLPQQLPSNQLQEPGESSVKKLLTS